VINRPVLVSYLEISFSWAYSAAMDEPSQPRRFVQHWPLVAVGTAWLLLFAGFLGSEIVRASVAIGGIALMVYQWRTYRKTSNGAQLVFLSLIVAGFGLASVWLALNVVRFYTYNPESAHLWAWHMLVIRVQDALIWGIGALVVTVSLWTLLQFAQWFGRRMSSSP
jgi:hypothetical protein